MISKDYRIYSSDRALRYLLLELGVMSFFLSYVIPS